MLSLDEMSQNSNPPINLQQQNATKTDQNVVLLIFTATVTMWLGSLQNYHFETNLKSPTYMLLTIHVLSYEDMKCLYSTYHKSAAENTTTMTQYKQW